MLKSLVNFLLIVLLSIILIASNHSVVQAQSISSLNGEIINLRTRINRLESDLSFLKRSIPSNRNIPNTPTRESPSSTINNPPAINNTVVGRSDPLFQRLATLVIELKEDVKNLDRRLKEIETKN